MAELAPQDVIASYRRPKVLITDRYLNDRIEFNNDSRFVLDTAIAQLSNFPTISKDGANFSIVDLGTSGSALYAIEMYATTLDREKFEKNIDVTFRELI